LDDCFRGPSALANEFIDLLHPNTASGIIKRRATHFAPTQIMKSGLITTNVKADSVMHILSSLGDTSSQNLAPLRRGPLFQLNVFISNSAELRAALGGTDISHYHTKGINAFVRLL
jgi:hypothetical protein